MLDSRNKIALGTVQFGLNYGIANKRGQISGTEAKKIIELAKFADIDTLDTAIAYGSSEATLGEIGVNSFNIISKIPFIPAGEEDVRKWVQVEVSRSLQRLRVSNLYGLLLHKADDLLSEQGPDLYLAMCDARERGLIRKIGVSIYGPEELDLVLPCYDLDLVQAPFSILDTRMADSGWLTRLEDMGIEFHARSIFLQGLLLFQPGEIPSQFNSFESLFESWREWLTATNQTALEACLRFALATPAIRRVVVGVDTAEHLQSLLDVTPISKPDRPDWPSFDPRLVIPSAWSTL